MTLTAGSWWITAVGTVSEPGFESSCTLEDQSNSITLDSATFNFRNVGQGGSVASYFLTALYAVSGDTAIAVQCAGSNANETITAVLRTSSGLGSAVGTSSDAGSTFSGTAWHTIGSLALSKGNWWIAGKTNVANSSTSLTSSVGCRIMVKPDKDQSSQSMYYTPQPGDKGEVAVQMAHSFSSAGTARLQCTDPKGRPTNVDHVKLTAYKIGRLTRMPVGGSNTSTGGSTALPKLVTRYLNGSLALGVGSWKPVVTLNVPAGDWLVSAKTLLKDSIGTYVECHLDGPGSSDSWPAETFGSPGGGLTPLYMQLAFSTPSATTVTLGCEPNDAGTSVTFSRVTMLQIAPV